MRRLIIEPHGDDALFSMFDLLKDRKDGRIDHLDIITLASTRSSQGLVDLGYADSAIFVELLHSDFKMRYAQPKLVNSLYKEGRNLTTTFDEMCQMSPHHGMLLKAIKKLDLDKYDEIHTVLGIVHDDHIIVRSILQELVPEKLVMYMDVPYCDTVYGRKMVNSALDTFKLIVEEEIPYDKESYEAEKLSVLRAVYPSEMGFMRFNGDSINMKTRRLRKI